MGTISTEQKLQLVRQIRAECQDNRMKMRNRERMLYGAEHQPLPEQPKEYYPLYSKGCYENEAYDSGMIAEKERSAQRMSQTGQDGKTFSSFKLRLVLAVLLFAGFLVVDSDSGTFAGISTAALIEEVNKDFDTGLEEVIFDFENNFPYTLFKK